MENQFKIIILFSEPRKKRWWILSQFIKWSEYQPKQFPCNFFHIYHSSHCSVLQGDLVTEAVLFTGIRQIYFANWHQLNKVNLAREISLSKDEFEDIAAFLEGSIGVRYAWLSACGIFIQRVFKTLIGMDIKNPLKSQFKTRKCTELVFDAFRKIKNFHIPIDLAQDSVGVKTIENLTRDYWDVTERFK